jgi:hypothetical protein
VRTVAALYVDPRGPYPKMPGVECWDESRDARLYAGPHPVVAHPPCGPWGKLSHFSRQDPSGGPAAVASVRAWGGALEHPVGSKLWRHCQMPMPGELPDEWGGYTILVEQVSWGHCTRKPTLLYIVGSPMPTIRTGGEPTHSVCNGRGQRLTNGTVRLRATAEQARMTPPAFAEFLVGIARSCRRTQAA